MKTVVIAENLTQFYDYVLSRLKQPIPKKLIQSSGGCITVENMNFYFCNEPRGIAGMSFDKDDHIVQVGSWYNISEKTRNKIIDSFTARKAAKKIPMSDKTKLSIMLDAYQRSHHPRRYDGVYDEVAWQIKVLLNLLRKNTIKKCD